MFILHYICVRILISFLIRRNYQVMELGPLANKTFGHFLCCQTLKGPFKNATCNHKLGLSLSTFNLIILDPVMYYCLLVQSAFKFSLCLWFMFLRFHCQKNCRFENIFSLFYLFCVDGCFHLCCQLGYKDEDR